MDRDQVDPNAPFLVQRCPNCLGDGHLPTVDFDTMETIEEICEECGGSGERYINKYDLLEVEEQKVDLYED